MSSFIGSLDQIRGAGGELPRRSPALRGRVRPALRGLQHQRARVPGASTCGRTTAACPSPMGARLSRTRTPSSAASCGLRLRLDQARGWFLLTAGGLVLLFGRSSSEDLPVPRPDPRPADVQVEGRRGGALGRARRARADAFAGTTSHRSSPRTATASRSTIGESVRQPMKPLGNTYAFYIYTRTCNEIEGPAVARRADGHVASTSVHQSPDQSAGVSTEVGLGAVVEQLGTLEPCARLAPLDRLPVS